MTATLSPDTIVAATAKGLSRRRMLGNAGSVALGAALFTALGAKSDVAEAQCASAYPCGPAPMCGCDRCNDGYSWQCDGAEPNTDPARWGPGSQPCSPSYGNCWMSGSIHCCDCCAYFPTCRTGALCYNCGAGNWYKCICREGAC